MREWSVVLSLSLLQLFCPLHEHAHNRILQAFLILWRVECILEKNTILLSFLQYVQFNKKRNTDKVNIKATSIQTTNLSLFIIECTSLRFLVFWLMVMWPQSPSLTKLASVSRAFHKSCELWGVQVVNTVPNNTTTIELVKHVTPSVGVEFLLLLNWS